MVNDRCDVLIVDDDEATRLTAALAVRRAGGRPHLAMTGTEARTVTQRQRVDVALIDLRLPDVDGLTVARDLQSRSPRTAVIVISAWMTVPIAIEAMRLGAVDVLEKPVTPELLERAVRLAVWMRGQPEDTGGDDTARPALANAVLADGLGNGLADRWARLVFDARQSTRDFKTIDEWARARGISASSLREICRLMRIPPHDGRDLARMYRAVCLALATGEPVEASLNVGDARTLTALLDRAGLSRQPSQVASSVQAFLSAQTFVATNNPGIARLNELSRTLVVRG